MTRKCSNCQKQKPLAEFYRKRQKIGGKFYEGYQSRCKACNAEVCRESAQRARIKASRAHEAG